MALQKAYTKLVFGKTLTFDQAYSAITTVQGDKNSLNIVVVVYDTRAKANIIDQLYYSFRPSVAEDAKNFYKQGYEYLKTLDEFKDATDVLEEGQTA